MDDFLLFGDLKDKVYLRAKEQLRRAYRWVKWGTGATTVAGIDLEQDSSGRITMSMDNCIRKNCNSMPLTNASKTLPAAQSTHQELGKQYVVLQSRLGIGTDDTKLSQM